MLRHYRQRGRCLCLLLLIALPAGSKDGFALGGEALTGTVHRNDRFCVAMWFIHRTKQAPCRQLQHLAFAQRQRGYIYLFRADGGNNGVVIGDFLLLHTCLAQMVGGFSMPQTAAAAATRPGTLPSISLVRKRLSVRG